MLEIIPLVTGLQAAPCVGGVIISSVWSGVTGCVFESPDLRRRGVRLKGVTSEQGTLGHGLPPERAV